MKIIAEIGVNHNGSLDLARKLIDEAAKAGAQSVKFQTFSAARLAAVGTPKVGYQLTTSDPKESHYEMLKKLELTQADHIELLNYCEHVGVEFCSTPYSRQDAEMLEQIGVPFFKTASADIIDRQLHEFIASTGKPCLIAVGMASLGEIEEVLSIYDYAGCRDAVTLMHCVSSYPAPMASLNMSVITTLAEAFGVSVGYSDHAKGTCAAIMSVALGGSVIEKHFTLDTSMEGPDHQASSTPEEFAYLVREVLSAELALGDRVKRIQKCEEDMRKVSRKSIVAAKEIKKGDVLSEEDILFQRPGTGESPMKYPRFIGRHVRRDISAGEMISLAELEA